MNKKELVTAMEEKTWLSTKDCSSALQAFVDVVSEQLQNQEDVSEGSVAQKEKKN